MYSVALSGLSFVNALVPGVLRFAQAQAESTPVCGLSRLRRFSPDSNNIIPINVDKNYFQALKIYFQSLIIYFQGLIIYFQTLKIIFSRASRTL